MQESQKRQFQVKSFLPHELSINTKEKYIIYIAKRMSRTCQLALSDKHKEG